MTNFEKLRGHKLSRMNIFEDIEKKKINFYVTVLLYLFSYLFIHLFIFFILFIYLFIYLSILNYNFT